MHYIIPTWQVATYNASKSDAIESVLQSKGRTIEPSDHNSISQNSIRIIRLWIAVVYQTMNLESAYSLNMISWTHCDLAMPYGDIWVNIGSSNDLLPGGTKVLPEPILNYHRWGSVALI